MRAIVIEKFDGPDSLIHQAHRVAEANGARENGRAPDRCGLAIRDCCQKPTAASESPPEMLPSLHLRHEVDTREWF